MQTTRRIGAVVAVTLLFSASVMADDDSQSTATDLSVRSNRIVPEEIIEQLREEGSFTFPSGAVIRTGWVEKGAILRNVRIEYSGSKKGFVLTATHGEISSTSDRTKSMIRMKEVCITDSDGTDLLLCEKWWFDFKGPLWER